MLIITPDFHTLRLRRGALSSWNRKITISQEKLEAHTETTSMKKKSDILILTTVLVEAAWLFTSTMFHGLIHWVPQKLFVFSELCGK